jgi:hypothetical protein
MLKAVDMLSAPATYNVDHVRPMIEYLLTGLRRGLTLGVLPISSPSLQSYLYADRLDKSAMTKQEANEVSPSHPFDWRVLHPGTSSLRCSKRSDVKTVQVSARSPRLSLGWGTTLLLCCAWTISSRPLSSCKSPACRGSGITLPLP